MFHESSLTFTLHTSYAFQFCLYSLPKSVYPPAIFDGCHVAVPAVFACEVMLGKWMEVALYTGHLMQKLWCLLSSHCVCVVVLGFSRSVLANIRECQQLSRSF